MILLIESTHSTAQPLMYTFNDLPIECTHSIARPIDCIHSMVIHIQYNIYILLSDVNSVLVVGVTHVVCYFADVILSDIKLV